MTIDLDKIFEFLNSLGGMPKCGLVFIFCLALGIGLKKAPWIHNSAIPTIVILSGMLILPMLSDWPSSTLHSVRVFILTQALVGFITATISLVIDKLALRPMLKKVGLKEWDSDPPFPKDDGSNVKTETKPNGQ